MDAPVAQAETQTPTQRNGERGRAVDAAITQIEKQFGRGAIMRLGDKGAKMSVEVVPTGSIALDLALGVGGVPRGRITEIFGPESSGKTTLCYHIAANAQRAGGIVAFIDAEHALDPSYAKNVGLNVDELLVSQPDTGEQALEIAETLIRSNGVDVVIIDSVAALVPRAEIEGEMGDSFVGLQARLMSQALRKLTGAINRSNTALIFTNQLREKIGVMFGNPETTPGGRALKFYCSRAPGHPPHRDPQERDRCDRLADPRQGRQEQGRQPLPAGRVRHHVQRGHQPRGRPAGRRHRGRHPLQDRRLVQLRRDPARPGTRELARLPEGHPELADQIESEIRGKVASIEVGVEGIPEAE